MSVTTTGPIVGPSVGSAVAEVIIAPTAVQLDSEGRAVSDPATVPPRRQHVDSIPWLQWVDSETACLDAKFAKLVLELAVRRLHRFLMADPSLLPVAFIRKGKEIQAQSTEQIKKGGCVIPIF